MKQQSFYKNNLKFQIWKLFVPALFVSHKAGRNWCITIWPVRVRKEMVTQICSSIGSTTTQKWCRIYASRTQKNLKQAPNGCFTRPSWRPRLAALYNALLSRILWCQIRTDENAHKSRVTKTPNVEAINASISLTSWRKEYNALFDSLGFNFW